MLYLLLKVKCLQCNIFGDDILIVQIEFNIQMSKFCHVTGDAQYFMRAC